jgi:hypothetical protein
MKAGFFLVVFFVFSGFAFGQFGDEVRITGESVYSAWDVFSVDLDGDLDLDVLSAAGNGQISWFENLGGGLFAMQKDISYEANVARSVCAADLDGDGDNDVISSSISDHKIAWYKNLGNGFFGTQQVVSITCYEPYKVCTADLDEDGDIDILAASYLNDNIVWFENSGTGTFGSQQIIGTGLNGAWDVYACDYDNDGDFDVFSVSIFDNKFALFENSGGANFAPVSIISTALNNPRSIYSIDVDGDGDEDLLTASNNDNKIAWYSNLGGGNLGAQQIITTSLSGAWSVSAADLDNDGDNDVMACGFLADNIVWFENSGTGTFAPAQTITAQVNAPKSFASGDLNNDGHIDIISAGTGDHRVAWYQNSGSGSFGTQKRLTTLTEGVTQIFMADLDGDNLSDIISASQWDNRLSWFKNLGFGEFGNQIIISSTAMAAYAVTAADIDADGDNDIILGTNGDYSIKWYENSGSGTFGAPQVISAAVNNLMSITVTDLDSDGDLDILTASQGDSKLARYENLGGGIFGPQVIISTIVFGPTSVQATDLDGDFDIDVVATSASDYKVYWFENVGSLIFTDHLISTSAQNPRFIFLADLDNDLDQDILCASRNDDKVAWYENSGTGVFSSEQIISVQADWACHVSAIDFDEDGDLDVFSASELDNKIAMYENFGDGTFGPQLVISTLSVGASLVTPNDIDQDGDQDILCTGRTDGKISFHSNMLYSPRQIRGEVFFDEDEDGYRDSTEGGFGLISVQTDPLNAFPYTYSSGTYVFNLDTGVSELFTVQPVLPQYWTITSDSLFYTVLVDSEFIIADSLDFGLHPDTVINVLNSELVGEFSSCNSNITYCISLKNIGTTTPSGVLHLKLDNSLTYLDCVFPPDSISGQNLYWSYDSLFYFSFKSICLSVQTPDFNSMGDTLCSVLKISVLDSLGNLEYETSDTLNQILVCAYDPNDKISDPSGVDSLGYIPLGTEYLEYTIRFQNTGTDTAHNVVIKDFLDTNLDWQSLVPLASSHAFQLYVNQFGEMTFTFLDIMLPDSNINEPFSHGFIKYGINIDSNVVSGSSILNTAFIYFDENPAVITNTKINTIFDCISVLENTSIETAYCEGDSINGEVLQLPSSVEFSWSLAGLHDTTGSVFKYPIDTSGLFEMHLETVTSFCSQDSMVEILIYSQIPLQTLPAVDLCIGDSVLVFSQYKYSSGIYYDTLVAINGCDSIVSLEVFSFVPPPVQYLPDAFICDGDSVLIFGNYQNQAGTYQDTLQTILGCDSISTKLLIVWSSPTSILPSNYICSGDSLMIFDQYQNISGTFYDSLQTIHGCDSTLVMELFVLPNYQLNEGVSEICFGDSLLIFGVYHFLSDVYYDTLQSINGCDSILSKQLNVLPLPSVNFNTLSQDTLCIYSSPITISANPAGGNYSGNGVTSNQFNPSIAGQGTHYIYYNYTDVLGCSAIDSAKVFVDACLGIDPLTSYTISIYPNPFKDYTTINFGQELTGNHSVYIYDLLGQVVYSIDNIKGNQLEIQRNKLNSGVYIFSLFDATIGQEVYTTKLIVE